jgi:addiction module RelE/StbE family toxin
MRVILTDRARARLRSIRTYVTRHNPPAAERVVEKILRAAERLSDNPHLGPRWRDGPTRALVVTGLPYRIHYAVNEADDIVQVIHIAHTSQRPIRRFDRMR